MYFSRKKGEVLKQIPSRKVYNSDIFALRARNIEGFWEEEKNPGSALSTAAAPPAAMMARMGGGVSAAVTRKKKAARELRKKQAEGADAAELEELEEEIAEAEKDDRQQQLMDNAKVVEELAAEAIGFKPKKEEFDGEDYTGWKLQYLWIAWRCRKIEQSNFFVAFIMTVILLASVLVGVNTYETDSRGQQLLGNSVIRTLAGIETAILVIFWFELVLKAVGCGLQPWRFFFVGWCVRTGSHRQRAALAALLSSSSATP